MRFKITMTVGEAQLGGVLAHFNKSQLADINLEPIPQVTTVAKTNGKRPANKKVTGTPDSRICLGNTSHQVGGEVSIAMVNLLEKMESEQGIGNITRRILSSEAKKRGITEHPNEPIMAMLKAGHMVIVGED